MTSLALPASTDDLPARWRDRIGRGLMLLAAIGAATAFASALPSVRAAGADTVWLETWRLFGYVVFAGLFALLAWRPRALPGIWELAFLHKAAMASAAMVLVGAREADMAGPVDAVLAIAIAVAYGCCKGWLGWRSPNR